MSTKTGKEVTLDKHNFRAEIKKSLYLHNMGYKDLAEATGYTPGTIRIMMHDDSRLSPAAMKKISDALDIDMKGDA